MNAYSTSPALADSLETLSQDWQNTAMAQTKGLAPTPDLDGIRERLNGLADAAEAAERTAEGQALRRIALLSEVWECLRSEPGQEESAADLASFCSRAITLLAGDQTEQGGDLPGTALSVLEQSYERWSDYLALVDPTSHAAELAGESAACDEQWLPEETEPPAIDARTLLRLIGGSEEVIPPSRELDLQIPSLPKQLDLDHDMRDAFLVDATELFERIESLVVGLAQDGDHRGAIAELARCFHTLKGAAGSVGLSELAALIHSLEERLEQASGRVSDGLNDLLHQVVGYLDDVIGLLRRCPGAPGPAAVEISTALGGTVPDPVSVEVAPEPQGPAAEGPIRVPTARFDELTNLAGELIVQGRFWLSQAESIRTFAATVRASKNRLLGSMERLHEAGLGREHRRFRTPADPRSDLPGQLCRLAEQADDMTVMAERRRPRQPSWPTAATRWSGSRTSFGIPSNRCGSSRSEACFTAWRAWCMMQHGSKAGRSKSSCSARRRAWTGQSRTRHSSRCSMWCATRWGTALNLPTTARGLRKPAMGKVTLEARREANAVVIAVEDDGRGLDKEAIAKKARRLGWLAPDVTPSAEQLHAFIFQAGFSTRAEANAISGRGVGMDVVAREVSKLRGTIDLTSQAGRGTRVTLRLPSQLALEPALIVRVAGQGFAVPASQIESVQPFEPPVPSSGSPSAEPAPAAVSPAGAGRTVLFRDQAIPVVFASETLLFGRSDSPAWPKLVVVRTGSRNIGWVVDSIEGNEDLLIKPLGALLAGHPLVAGTSLSVNGELISVINPTGLERWLKLSEISETVPALSSPPTEPCRLSRRERPAVLVADDSISVRRGMARQLAQLGMDVHEVSDGMEALSRLRGASYALVVTDLEMPRLDGFALLTEMKHSALLAAIPVVVASSLTDAETRRRVLELGAQALLSKPVDPRKLARTVEEVLSGVRQ